jgi:hypothetical protein
MVCAHATIVCALQISYVHNLRSPWREIWFSRHNVAITQPSHVHEHVHNHCRDRTTTVTSRSRVHNHCRDRMTTVTSRSQSTTLLHRPQSKHSLANKVIKAISVISWFVSLPISLLYNNLCLLCAKLVNKDICALRIYVLGFSFTQHAHISVLPLYLSLCYHSRGVLRLDSCISAGDVKTNVTQVTWRCTTSGTPWDMRDPSSLWFS